MSFLRFDLSTVTVKQSFSVSQIVRKLSNRSLLVTVLFDSVNKSFVRCR